MGSEDAKLRNPRTTELIDRPAIRSGVTGRKRSSPAKNAERLQGVSVGCT